MNHSLDSLLGVLVQRGRRSRGLSQRELARRMGCPQATVSRLERGRRSASLAELAGLAGAFGLTVDELLAELERASVGGEAAALAQLAAYGVRFLGGPAKPALCKLGVEEALLGALPFLQDPRVFEALPGLLLRHGSSMDWGKALSGAQAQQLQNRLGMVVAAALQLEGTVPDTPAGTWAALRKAHARLAEARLDRQEVLGPRPRTREGLAFLAERTPPWLRPWGLGSVDVASLRERAAR